MKITCTPRAHKEKGNAGNVAFGNQIDHWSGMSFDFLRCRCLSCFSTDFGSTCSGFFSTSAGGEPFGVFTMCQSAESTLGFLRCRRLISPCSATTTNCPVLSPGSLSSSIEFTISCGTRTSIFFDFALIALVAMYHLFVLKCQTMIHVFSANKNIDMSDTLGFNLCQTPIIEVQNGEAQRGRQSGWASNHNVTEAYIMACSHDTQTRPEFTYLFLGTPSDKPDATPIVLRAEANTEQQARSHFLNWKLVFAAQIRTKAPCRLQLFDGGDHFAFIFEQRFDACTSGVQEVAHG